jgi:hypothetical protein
MKRSVLTLTLSAMLISACEFQSYRDYRNPAYEGVFTWTEVTGKAPWSRRQEHASVWFNDRLWVMGGYNPGAVQGDTYLEDVWSSADGESWDLVTERAPWLGRRGHAGVVFDDGSGEAMYLIGGFVVDEESGYREYRNDVWKSTDGLNWSQIKERTEPELDSLYDWYPRFNHACVVARHGGTDYIYLIGGAAQLEGSSSRYAMKYFNDVWRSSDGISWEQLPANDFGFRAEHAATVDPATQRIYLQGGRHGVLVQDEENASHPVPDFYWLWSSADGVNWTPANDTAEFDQHYLSRAEHQLVFMGEQLFGFPGRNASNVHFHFTNPGEYTFWRLDPGNLWSVDSEGSDFDARYSYSMAVHEGKVWILGGDTNSRGPANDVWVGEIN